MVRARRWPRAGARAPLYWIQRVFGPRRPSDRANQAEIAFAADYAGGLYREARAIYHTAGMPYGLSWAY